MKRLISLTLGVLAVAWIYGPARGGEGTEVTLDGLKSRTPGTWKMQKPTSKFRAYQFLLPRAEGDSQDAELAIFFFDGGGGGVDENIKRWKSQFQPPQGKSIDEVSKVEKFKVGNVQVTYLDLHGTFLSRNPPFDPNAKVTPMPEYRRFGVIFASPNGPYFITVTGPAKTMAKHKTDFDNWLKAFK